MSQWDISSFQLEDLTLTHVDNGYFRRLSNYCSAFFQLDRTQFSEKASIEWQQMLRSIGFDIGEGVRQLYRDYLLQGGQLTLALSPSTPFGVDSFKSLIGKDLVSFFKVSSRLNGVDMPLTQFTVNKAHFSPPVVKVVETVAEEEPPQSGYLPTDYCESTETVSIPKAGLNSNACPYHKTIHLDKTGKFRVHSNCESPSKMQHVPWFVLPPVEEFYYKNNHPNYKLLPPYRADCLASLTDKEQPMELIYPKRIAQIYVPIDLEGKLLSTVFKVAHRQPETAIYWHLDNEYLGSTTTFHEFALNPAKGKHKLTLVDKDGHRLETEFEIIGKE